MEVDEIAVGIAHGSQAAEGAVARLLLDDDARAPEASHERIDIIRGEADGDGRAVARLRLVVDS